MLQGFVGWEMSDGDSFGTRLISKDGERIPLLLSPKLCTFKHHFMSTSLSVSGTPAGVSLSAGMIGVSVVAASSAGGFPGSAESVPDCIGMSASGPDIDSSTSGLVSFVSLSDSGANVAAVGIFGVPVVLLVGWAVSVLLFDISSLTLTISFGSYLSLSFSKMSKSSSRTRRRARHDNEAFCCRK